MYANVSWQRIHSPYLIKHPFENNVPSTVKQPMNGQFSLLEITAVYLFVMLHAVRVVIFPESLIQTFEFTP